MRLLTENSLKNIRRIIFGGEGYPKSKLVDVFDMFNERIVFYNVYGPTECTCICSCYKVSQDDFETLDGFLPLGEMVPNFKYYILDDKLRPSDKGANGELYLYGPAIGYGYCNDLKRTEAVFFNDKFCTRYSRKVYRTGDIVNYNAKDGKLYIIGRLDNQVKHMGYRIELEEIETCVTQLQYINQACCVCNVNNDLSELTLFISLNEEVTGIIRDDIKNLIPKYMVPSKIHIIDKLPLNSNGKIDRKGLSLKARAL